MVETGVATGRTGDIVYREPIVKADGGRLASRATRSRREQSHVCPDARGHHLSRAVHARSTHLRVDKAPSRADL